MTNSEQSKGNLAALLCALSFATGLGLDERMEHGLNSAYYSRSCNSPAYTFTNVSPKMSPVSSISASAQPGMGSSTEIIISAVSEERF